MRLLAILHFNLPLPLPHPFVSEFSGLLTFRLFELIAPTEDAGLGAVMLSLGLVAPLHPDTGHGSMDVDVLGSQHEGLLTGGEGVVVLTGGEVDFGFGQPSFEAGRIGRDRRLQLRESCGFVADGEVERRLFRQGQGAC